MIGKTYHDLGVLDADDIQYEIKFDKPIICLLDLDGTTNNHMITITGYDDVHYTSSNPRITFHDPAPGGNGGTFRWLLTYVQKTTGNFTWIETLRFQYSGIGGTGIFDGVAITDANFIYTAPASARTYNGSFVRASGSNDHVSQWTWSLSFSHAGGEYIVSSFNYTLAPNDFSLATTWNAPAFTLPTNYVWNYSNEGAVKGKLTLACLDDAGYDHSRTKDIFYIPVNPYPSSISYAYVTVSTALPEVKAHNAIILQDYQMNSGANITFRAGETIEIRENVSVQNGCVANFIVDPSVRN